jgi:dTDP-4-amino-4,6-dideoxygalactose transaminase
MRLHGMSRDAFDRFTAKVPSWYYEIVAPGFKYNLTDIAAALGLHQLKKAQGFQQRGARQIAARYDEAFADLPWSPPPCRGGRRPARLAPVCAAPGRRRRHRARCLHRAAVRAGHRLQRALHPAAPAPLLARPLRLRPESSRTASRPTSAC